MITRIRMNEKFPHTVCLMKTRIILCWKKEIPTDRPFKDDQDSIIRKKEITAYRPFNDDHDFINANFYYPKYKHIGLNSAEQNFRLTLQSQLRHPIDKKSAQNE